MGKLTVLTPRQQKFCAREAPSLEQILFYKIALPSTLWLKKIPRKNLKGGRHLLLITLARKIKGAHTLRQVHKFGMDYLCIWND